LRLILCLTKQLFFLNFRLSTFDFRLIRCGAFDRFFKGLAKYPKFKKKYHHDSFTLDNGGGKAKPITIGGFRHKLPFIGWVNTFEQLPTCSVKKVTISRQAGDWYLSFTIELPDEKQAQKAIEVVGVDLGVNALATLSTGKSFPNPKPLRKALKKLTRLQRDAIRKVYGSHNYKKASLKVARLHRISRKSTYLMWGGCCRQSVMKQEVNIRMDFRFSRNFRFVSV